MASPSKHTASHLESIAMEKAAEVEQAEGNDVIDTKAEKRLLMKQDILILPLLAFSIMFGYLVSHLRCHPVSADIPGSRQHWQRSSAWNAEGDTSVKSTVL